MKTKDLYEYLKSIEPDVNKGRFFADKSYAYDTIYFVSRFFLNSVIGNNLVIDKDRLFKYLSNIFALEINHTAVINNYYRETVRILKYAKIIAGTPSNNVYKIIRQDILEFITEKIENSYIFNYLLAYNLLERNEDLYKCYKDFASTKEKYIKKAKIEDFYEIIIEIFNTIGERQHQTNTQWSKQNAKYILNVLGYLNKSEAVTRELNLSGKSDIDTISINVTGTRSSHNLVKKNDYIKNFNKSYVECELLDYAFVTIKCNPDTYKKSVAVEISDMYIDLVNEEKRLNQDSSIPKNDIPMYIDSNVRARNPKLQSEFRSKLLKEFTHKCAICDLTFDSLLRAGHIIPLSECDDPISGFDINNGILLCANHDILFENSNYISFDDNGAILIGNEISSIQKLLDISVNTTRIEKKYLTSERMKYLKKHKDKFIKKQT